MSKEVTIVWLGERKFMAEDEKGAQTAINCEPVGGKGLGPSGLLLASLGGCLGTTVIGVLEKKRQQVTDFEIRIEAEQMPDWPKAFTNIHVIYRITGEQVAESAAERAVTLAETRYCTVSASLSVPVSHEILVFPVQELDGSGRSDKSDG